MCACKLGRDMLIINIRKKEIKPTKPQTQFITHTLFHGLSDPGAEQRRKEVRCQSTPTQTSKQREEKEKQQASRYIFTCYHKTPKNTNYLYRDAFFFINFTAGKEY